MLREQDGGAGLRNLYGAVQLSDLDGLSFEKVTCHFIFPSNFLTTILLLSSSHPCTN